MMERQVDHMVRLVDDLLEVSRITRGKIELRMEPVELAWDRAERDRDRPSRCSRPLGLDLEVCLPSGVRGAGGRSAYGWYRSSPTC